jgi:hypothetical protein
VEEEMLNNLTSDELVEMLKRIPDETLGQEAKLFFESVKGVEEARETLLHFLQFYVMKK